jgi:hypothetical protein
MRVRPAADIRGMTAQASDSYDGVPTSGLKRHSYRSSSQTIACVLAPVVLAVLVAALAARPQPSPHEGHGKYLPYMIAFVVLFTAACWRAARARIVVSSNGVRVHNVLSSFALSWSEIERFDIGRSGLWPSVCRVHLRDGRILAAWGIQETNAAMVREESKRPAARVVKRLNEDLARHSNIASTASR